MDIVKVGVIEGVRNDAYLKSVGCGVAYRETDTINCDTSLIHGHVATTHHFGRGLVSESEDVASLLVFDGCTLGGGIYVALDDMAIESSVHHHRTFNIDGVSHMQLPKIAAQECFAHGRDGIVVVSQSYYSKANTIMGNALVDFQLSDKAALKSEMQVIEFFLYRDHAGGLFYYS